MRKFYASFVSLLFLAGPIGGFAQGMQYLPGEVLVQLQAGHSAEEITLDLAVMNGEATNIHVEKELSPPMHIWMLRFNHQVISQEQMLRAVQAHPAVRLAQNNHVIQERSTVPNDPNLSQQWHHVNANDADIDSDLAWDITTGGLTATGDTIVVCIIENSDLPHPDLAANAWYNWNEIPNNGVDDDGNGYIDDFEGWNPSGNNDNVYGGGHGTQVAGMIGAVGDNNLGVVGANWNVKMMPVTYSSLNEAAVIQSYTYPLVMRKLYNQTNGDIGAFVVATNASWGIDGGDPNSAPLWCAFYDSLGVHGVLNCGATANNAVDVDVVGDLPTACPSDFMVSVTATNNVDQRTFSAWGATTIDVGAPGSGVWTTSIGGGYGSTSGTSFASPLTAGVIGLLYSAPCVSMMQLVHSDPQAGALYVRDALFAGVDQVGNLPGNTVTGGRINSFNSLNEILNNCGACPVPYGLEADPLSATSAQFTWNAVGNGPFTLQYRELGSATWTTIGNLINTGFVATGLTACTDYEYQVEAECDTITSGFSQVFTLLAPTEPTPTIGLDNDEVICQGDIVTLTSSAVTNLWSDGTIGNSITVDQTGTYSVTAIGICDSAASDVVDILVLQTTLPTTSDVNLPGPGVATMTATGDSIVWYDMATGGSPVGFGNSWDTPFLNSPTDYWCSNVVSNGGLVSYGGKTNNTTNSGQYHTNGTNYILFTAFDAFEIKSVKVYANGAASRPIGLVDVDNNLTIAQGNFSIPDGESRVQLDFEVPGPGNYGLRIMSGNPQLWRDGLGSNPNYPFALGTLGELTGTTVTGGNSTEYYYFFYDWEVATISTHCESDRVQASVNMPVGIEEIDNGAVDVFPVPADDIVRFSMDALQGMDIQVRILDATGRLVETRQTRTGGMVLHTSAYADGLYLFELVNEGRQVAQGRFSVRH